MIDLQCVTELNVIDPMIKLTLIVMYVGCTWTTDSASFFVAPSHPRRITGKRLFGNSSWLGPLISANGSSFEFTFSVTLQEERCCPGLVVTTEPQVPRFARGGCYNITRNDLATLYRILPTHILLDWKAFSYGVNCFKPNSRKIYTCYGSTWINLNSMKTAGVYAFYPCYIQHQNIDLFSATISLNVLKKSIQCMDISEQNTKHCYNYYNKTNLPNVFGTRTLPHADIILFMVEPVIKTGCHKYVEEFFCRTMLPECVPNEYVISPCKSMCKEVAFACREPVESAFSLISEYDGNYKFTMDQACDFFPDDYCFTYNVTCAFPIQIENGILTYSGEDPPAVHNMAKYQCKEGYELDGNSTVYCEYSGEWSPAPKCTKGINKKQVTIIGTIFGVFVVLTIFFIILCSIYRQEIAIIMYAKFGIRFSKETEENREYDAFIAYSQEDIRFVKNKLLRPLESKRPPYKICIHHRDFELGATISANILNAIKQSKRTIIVLSQNFINSPWCHFEFEHAHIQLLKSQSHKLIVIALSEPKTLHNVPELIEAYIKTRTYLMSNDKWLKKKLFYHMPDKARKAEIELTEISPTEEPSASTNTDTSTQNLDGQAGNRNEAVNDQLPRHTWIM